VATTETRIGMFFGWRVVGAAFVLGAFGWGVGFFGPPVFLSVVRETRGWPLVLVSTARQPALPDRGGDGSQAGGLAPPLRRRGRHEGRCDVSRRRNYRLGHRDCALAAVPGERDERRRLGGAMSAAALNAIVSPWFVRSRPGALAMAYNGGSIGGVIFSPLWVAAIGALGFPLAAAAIGACMAVTMWVLADAVFSRTPQQMGLTPDGDAPGAPAASVTSADARALPGALLSSSSGSRGAAVDNPAASRPNRSRTPTTATGGALTTRPGSRPAPAPRLRSPAAPRPTSARCVRASGTGCARTRSLAKSPQAQGLQVGPTS